MRSGLFTRDLYCWVRINAEARIEAGSRVEGYSNNPTESRRQPWRQSREGVGVWESMAPKN